jgi:DNA-binding transcriptional ArsR family regulator
VPNQQKGGPARPPLPTHAQVSAYPNGKHTTPGELPARPDPAEIQAAMSKVLAGLPPEVAAKLHTAYTSGISAALAGNPELEALLPTLRLIRSDELLAREFSPPVWIVPDYLPAGLVMLAGRPKIGKSWLALQVCQAVATGGRVFGREIEPGRVLYLALEDHARRLQSRMQAQGWPEGNPSVDFMLGDAFRDQVGHLNSGGGARLARHIHAEGYRLVVVDTFSRALKGDQKDESEMTAALGPIQATALELEIAVVIVDHHKKPMGAADPNPVDDILGSTAKGGVADAIWGLYKEPGKHGAKLAITGRDMDEVTLKLVFDPGTGCWQCEGDAYEIDLTLRRKEILDALAMLGKAQLKDICETIGQPKSNTYTRLMDLVNAGLVLRIMDGKKPYYSLPDSAEREGEL